MQDLKMRFRDHLSNWLYDNIGYLIAGVFVAAVGGLLWLGFSTGEWEIIGISLAAALLGSLAAGGGRR